MILLLKAGRCSFHNWILSLQRRRLAFTGLSEQLSFQCKCKDPKNREAEVFSRQPLLVSDFLQEVSPDQIDLNHLWLNCAARQTFCINVFFVLSKKDWVGCGNQYLLDSDSCPFIFAVNITPNVDFYIIIQLLWTFSASE